MYYRPAQGYSLTHLVRYINEASRLKVPALIMWQDSALKTVYAVELINALDQHKDKMLIRLGTDIYTREKILQVEIPLELHGKLIDLL